MGKSNFTGTNVKFWANALIDGGTAEGESYQKTPVLSKYREIGLIEAEELRMARDRYLKEIARIQASYDQ